MSAVAGRFSPGALALAAGVGYVIAVSVTLAAWHFLALERSARAMERFGAQLAADLAFHAIDPMLRTDRIRLGLLANRMAERPEVRSIEMYSVDGAPLVIQGNPRANGAVYLSQVAIQDTVAGHVRVALRTEAFHPQTQALLAQSWAFLAVGLIVGVGGVYGYGRLAGRVANRALPVSERHEETESSSSRVFVLMATLFPRGRADPESDAEALRDGMATAERVANLYAGEAIPWRDAGVALIFPATTSEDRAFEVVCAALLVQRLLGDPHPDRQAADQIASEPTSQTRRRRSRFRLGLDLVAADRLHDMAASDRAPPEAVAVLASLAPNGGLVIGQAAYGAVANAERIELQAFENPAFQTLSIDAVPQGVVIGTDASHDALIARQADLVAVAYPST